MNKKQQHELENKIWDALEEPADLTPDEIAGIRERAHSAYMEKTEDDRQPRQKSQKKSGFLRRVVAVFAIAVGLMVLSVAYTVLAPVTVGNANSFVRRAVIWINDQLHLGISFPVPENEDTEIDSMKTYSFSSPEEAAEALKMPIAYLSNIDELSISGIDAMVNIDQSTSLFIRYSGKSGMINIEMQLLHNDVLDIIPIDNEVIVCPIGSVYILTDDEEKRAITFYNDYKIIISGTISHNLFEKTCHALSIYAVN